MAFGIVLSIIAIAGMTYGIVSKSKPLGIASSILLIVVIATWIYFYNNPY